jgi:DNA-binding MarR family transcriptional regulator
MRKEHNVLGALAMVLNDGIRSVTDASIGMSGETAAAVMLIGANPGLTVGLVAKALALTPSGTVRLIDKLAADGLVEKDHGTDQRTVVLSLTKNGLDKRAEIQSEREHVIERSMRGLSADDIAALGPLLDRMLSNMMESAEDDYRFCRMCDEDACEPRCPVEACRSKLVENTKITV